jgi:hypothetical protein
VTSLNVKNPGAFQGRGVDLHVTVGMVLTVTVPGPHAGTIVGMQDCPILLYVGRHVNSQLKVHHAGSIAFGVNDGHWTQKLASGACPADELVPSGQVFE